MIHLPRTTADRRKTRMQDPETEAQAIVSAVPLLPTLPGGEIVTHAEIGSRA
jgi:hypothetical protein